MEQTASYMVFRAGGRNCAVSVSYVLEVTENDGINPLPGAPGFVVGIKKFRNEVVPVIDAVKRLAIPKLETSDTPDKYIVIFEINIGSGIKKFGALVDKVLSVNEIPADSIKVVNEIDSQISSAAVIKGVVVSEENFIYVLLPEYFFSEKDLQRLGDIIE